MKARIFFTDTNRQLTTDYIAGRPTIEVDIECGFVPPANGQEFIPNFRRVRAVVDIGANATVVRPELVQGLKPIRTVSTQNILGTGLGDAFNALILISGFAKPYTIEVVRAELADLPAEMLLGRNVLSNYRLMYDPPKHNFYLEE